MSEFKPNGEMTRETLECLDAGLYRIERRAARSGGLCPHTTMTACSVCRDMAMIGQLATHMRGVLAETIKRAGLEFGSDHVRLAPS
jgi:hypothetical protein